MPETPNHGYNVPNEGEQDWHEPLNENFEQFETDVEIRDDAERGRENHEPHQGAKLFATNTGHVYLGDGSDWAAEFMVPRYDPAPEAHSGNLVLGDTGNTVLSDVRGGTISGGGLDGEADGTSWDLANEVTGDYGTVGGGRGNAAGTDATVGGGRGNEANAKFATVAGGGPADENSPDTTNNVVHDDHGTIAGGGNNRVGSDDGSASNATYAAVGGGRANTASYYYSTIAGGWNNENSGRYAFVGAGHDNVAREAGATISGGQDNTASGSFGTIGGGSDNTVGASLATVGGGKSNVAHGEQATVGGGDRNEANGELATIPGGEKNEARGSYSFAAGKRAKAVADGAFVWGDTSKRDVVSNQDDEFKVQAGGGAVIASRSDLSAGVELSPGSGSWASTSTRTAKSNVEPVDSRAVLEEVEDLDVSTWEYDGEADATHMGPMAEEFTAAFGLGSDERTIANVDADGVALAAIQGLSERLDEKGDRIDEKDERIDEQRDRIEDLEATVEEQRTEIDDLRAELDELRSELSA